MQKDIFLGGILSFLLPGLGQVYVKKVLRGSLLFILTALGYCFFILPGIVVHIIVIFDAIDEVKKYNNLILKRSSK